MDPRHRFRYSRSKETTYLLQKVFILKRHTDHTTLLLRHANLNVLDANQKSPPELSLSLSVTLNF